MTNTRAYNSSSVHGRWLVLQNDNSSKARRAAKREGQQIIMR